MGGERRRSGKRRGDGEREEKGRGRKPVNRQRLIFEAKRTQCKVAVLSAGGVKKASNIRRVASIRRKGRAHLSLSDTWRLVAVDVANISM